VALRHDPEALSRRDRQPRCYSQMFASLGGNHAD
jgi:hypothetical protein